jgi:hypothetical protein
VIYVESCFIRGLDAHVARRSELSPGDLLITHSGISVLLNRKEHAFSFIALTQNLTLERFATVWLRGTPPVVKQLRSRRTHP